MVACATLLICWRAPTRYIDDGRIEIDNNSAERALRTVALGRKNYLFAGSDAGGERAASIYTRIGAARLNGFDPESYLRTALERSQTIPSTASTNCCPGTSPLLRPPATDRSDYRVHEQNFMDTIPAIAHMSTRP